MKRQSVYASLPRHCTASISSLSSGSTLVFFHMIPYRTQDLEMTAKFTSTDFSNLLSGLCCNCRKNWKSQIKKDTRLWNINHLISSLCTIFGTKISPRELGIHQKRQEHLYLMGKLPKETLLHYNFRINKYINERKGWCQFSEKIFKAEWNSLEYERSVGIIIDIP